MILLLQLSCRKDYEPITIYEEEVTGVYVGSKSLNITNLVWVDTIYYTQAMTVCYLDSTGVLIINLWE